MECNPYYLSSPLDHASVSLQAAAAPTEGMEEGSLTDINEAAHTAVFLVTESTNCAMYMSMSICIYIEAKMYGGDFLALCTVVWTCRNKWSWKIQGSAEDDSSYLALMVYSASQVHF
jgi:hypothetical protein